VSFRRAAALGSGQRSAGNLLFSFDKTAPRDAVRSADARVFAQGLFDLLHGRGNVRRPFERWCEAIARLPRA
jgi:hypothetical protein